jgi:hypothetical protein
MQYIGAFGGSGGPTIIDGATVTVTVGGILNADVNTPDPTHVSENWTYSGQANVHIVHPDFETFDEVVPVAPSLTVLSSRSAKFALPLLSCGDFSSM